jgi:putative oxidoreductase
MVSFDQLGAATSGDRGIREQCVVGPDAVLASSGDEAGPQQPHKGATMSDTSPAMFSATDRLATNSTSMLLLVGRVLFGWLFFYSGYSKLMNIAGTTGYFTSLKIPAPGLAAWLAGGVEFLMGAALILGVATRYAALVSFVFVVIATLLAHRYWEFPAAQIQAQFNNFLKSLAIMGGALAIFVTGAGRFSVDSMMRK